jgi:hypothetical protein
MSGTDLRRVRTGRLNLVNRTKVKCLILDLQQLAEHGDLAS